MAESEEFDHRREAANGAIGVLNPANAVSSRRGGWRKIR
jgi:hypothetical protein